MLQSVYHATHARTHTRRCAEARAILHAGRGRAFFIRALRVHPIGRARALRILFLLLFPSRFRRDFFAATRLRNPRFPRKIPLSHWRSRISYSSVTYVF